MAIMLINSVVINRVDYCNSLLVGLPAYQTNRIQAVLNDAAIPIFGGSRCDHVTPILRLRAPQRIEFKVALLVFKALNNLAPDYIYRYCQSSSTSQRRSTLQSADEGILHTYTFLYICTCSLPTHSSFTANSESQCIINNKLDG